MPQLRKDPVVVRWVIINLESPRTPKDYDIPPYEWKGEKNCPFCYTHEHLTPPEIESLRLDGSQPNTPGWKVRVVPNKFPALRIEGDLDSRAVGLYDMCNGIGAHEVIIDSPYHYKGLADLTEEEITWVFKSYISRIKDLKNDPRFQYVLLFKNVGLSAGASLEHGHSQLIALPMVPKNVKEELQGAQRFMQFHERCIFCDIIRQEKGEGERILFENEDFVSFCPFFGRFPFEVWVLPKKHMPYFEDVCEEQLPKLASIMKKVFSSFKDVFGYVPYNYIIHNTPFYFDRPEVYHWHIEIMPRLIRNAGFEWGSGFYIVPTPPEMAVKFLKKEG